MTKEYSKKNHILHHLLLVNVTPLLLLPRCERRQSEGASVCFRSSRRPLLDSSGIGEGGEKKRTQRRRREEKAEREHAGREVSDVVEADGFRLNTGGAVAVLLHLRSSSAIRWVIMWVSFHILFCIGVWGPRCVANKSGRWGRGDEEAAAADEGAFLGS